MGMTWEQIRAEIKKQEEENKKNKELREIFSRPEQA